MKETTSAKKRTLIVGTVVLTSFITTFMGSALNLSIPSIDTEFQAGSRTVNWVITAYMLTCTGLAIPFGYFADGQKRNRVLKIGTAIFMAASVLAVFFASIGMLILFRSLQGIGAAMIFSSSLPILIDAFPEERRGQVLGYAACANYLGLSAGPVLGGILNTNFGWRSIFLCTAGISAVSLVCACACLTVHKHDPAEAGSAETGSAGRELRALYQRLLRKNPTFVCSNLAALISYGANFSITYLIALYLQVVQGYSAQHAGLILIAQTAAMAILSPFSGKLSDRFAPQTIAAAGTGICACALGIFLFLTERSSVFPVLLGLAVCGIGIAFFSTPNTHAVMAAVQKEDQGMAASVLSTMRSLGHTGCMLLITAVVGIYLQNSTLTEADPLLFVKTMRLVFLLFLLFCILGFFLEKKREM